MSSAPLPLARRPRRRRATRLALLAAGSLFALLLGEVAARVHGAVFRSGSIGSFLRYDERLGWSNLPGAAGRHRAPSFDVPVRIDERGCRVAERAAPPAPLDGAVWLLGDSMTFGWGVEEPRTFAGGLRASLAAPVCNFGVSGFGADQQLLQLRALLERARPAFVVVTFTYNDVVEVTQSRPYRRAKPRFELADGALALRGAPPPRDWWMESSHLWRAVMDAAGRFEPQQVSDEQRDRGRALVVRIYQEMKRACDAVGSGFLVVCHDAPWLTRRDREAPLPCCDLTEALGRLAEQGPVRFPDDGHWLPHVHEAVARELSAALSRGGLRRR
ncbi:MAG: SGNH/GDSL hydrolase family protein [Planctomycetota bacterium]